MAGPQGIALRLTGDQAADTASALVSRLHELGRRAECIDQESTEKVGTGAGFMCRLLARNGVIVIVTEPDIQLDCENCEVAVDPNDTPEFAAEKILDTLAEKGLVALELDDYSPEEEEQVRQRLSDLGYIE